MKIISIANLKGGVGKTTTAVNMAYILSDKGFRVLIVDNDIQSNTSAFFDRRGEVPNITDVYESGGDLNILKAAIKETRYPNLKILPATMELAGAIIEMSKEGDVTILKDSLRSLENDFDYVIIDNSPQMTANVINAIIASDDVIVPTEIDCFGMDGLEEISQQVQVARESGLNDNIKIAGVLVTKYNKRTKMDREGALHLERLLDGKLFKSKIRLTVKIKEAMFQQIPIVKYDKKSIAADDYLLAIEEYLEKEGK